MMAEAQAALDNANAQLAQENLKEMQARWEVTLEQLKLQLLQAQIAYATYAATADQQVYLAYLTAYTDAANTLYTAQGKLISLQAQLTEANAGLFNVQAAYDQLVTDNTNEIADNNAQIAYYEAQIAVLEESAGSSSAEELQASLVEAKTAWVKTATELQAAQTEVTNANTVLGQYDPTNTPYYNAFQAIVYGNGIDNYDPQNTEGTGTQVIFYDQVDGVWYWGYKMTNEATGTTDEFVPIIEATNPVKVWVSNSASQLESGAADPQFAFPYDTYTTFYPVQAGLETYISDKIYNGGAQDIDALKAAYEAAQPIYEEAASQNDAAYTAYTAAEEAKTAGDETLTSLELNLANALLGLKDNSTNLSSISQWSTLKQYLENEVTNTYSSLGTNEANVTWLKYYVTAVTTASEKETAQAQYNQAVQDFGDAQTAVEGLETADKIDAVGEALAVFKDEDVDAAWDAILEFLGGADEEGTYVANVALAAQTKANWTQTKQYVQQYESAAQTAANSYFAALNGTDPVGDALMAAYNTLTSQASSIASTLKSYNEQGKVVATLKVQQAVANAANKAAKGTYDALLNLSTTNVSIINPEGTTVPMDIDALNDEIAELQASNKELQYQIDNFYNEDGVTLPIMVEEPNGYGGYTYNYKTYNYNSIELQQALIDWLEDQIEVQEKAVEVFETLANKALENLENYVENMGSDDSGTTGGTTDEGGSTDGGTTDGE